MLQHFLLPYSRHPPELSCINNYNTTTTNGQKGSAQVRLPIGQHGTIFDPDGQEWFPDIGESSRKALRQFLGNENKLSRNLDAQNQFLISFKRLLRQKT